MSAVRGDSVGCCCGGTGVGAGGGLDGGTGVGAGMLLVTELPVGEEETAEA